MKENEFVFKAKDSLVSNESFSIHWDEKKQIAFTKIDPSINIEDYYKSAEYASHKTKYTSIADYFYHWAQKSMLTYKLKIILKYSAVKSVLDIGAGVGNFAQFLKNKGYKVSVVEQNEAAHNSCAEKGLTSFKSTNNILNTDRFDTLTLWHVLEHLPNLEEAFKQFNKLLVSNGTLFVAVPNWKSNDALHYKENWAGLDVPRHLWHFSTPGLVKLAKAHGFTPVACHPLWFDALYISYLSEKQMGKRVALLRGISKGIFFTFKAFFNKEYSSLIHVFKKG